jgi:hypothetical protein
MNESRRTHDMVHANCRQFFTANDFKFVADALARRGGESVEISRLIGDESARNAALDSQALFDALSDLPEPLPISAHLYFYVVTRHALTQRGVEDCDVSDYVASVLTEFSRTEKLSKLGAPKSREEFNYITDLLAATQRAPSEHVFLIHSHLGNYSLFIAGIFPQHVQHRVQRRGAPSIEFYEDVGASSYRLASDHQMARVHMLAEIYRRISEQFRDIRLALNRLAESHLHIEGAAAAERLLASGDGGAEA